MQLYLKSETYVHHHGTYYLVPLMVSVYMYTYLKSSYTEEPKIWYFFFSKDMQEIPHYDMCGG